MKVSVLGCGGAESGYTRVALAAVGRLRASALDAGLNAIDTAECYAGSEALIGRAVGRRRAEYYLFTKCGHAAEDGRADWRPRSLVESIERSLRRRSEEHTSELQSQSNIVCRLLLEKKKHIHSQLHRYAPSPVPDGLSQLPRRRVASARHAELGDHLVAVH